MKMSFRAKKTLLNAIFVLGLIFSLPKMLFSQIEDSNSSLPSNMQKQREVYSFIGVGDIMMGTHYPSTAYLPPNDGKTILDSVKTYLLDADITFGNLEGTFVDEGGDVKKCSNPSICYAFKMPTRYAAYLVEAGFDLLSVANNHVGDFGESGRRSTAQTLKNLNLNFAGLLAYPTTIIERSGLKVGFCAFSPNTGTLDIKNIPAAAKLVASLDSVCDIVIVSFHGGAEGSKMTHVTKSTELFLGEDRGNVYAFSHAVIDAGADIVFGHGPHVTRAVELYKNRFIAYSMGNFCTYGRFNLVGINGIAPIVKVFTNRTGEFERASIVSVKQIGEGIPVIDKSGRVYAEMKKLTQQDFPDTPLVFEDGGDIVPLKK